MAWRAPNPRKDGLVPSRLSRDDRFLPEAEKSRAEWLWDVRFAVFFIESQAAICGGPAGYRPDITSRFPCEQVAASNPMVFCQQEAAATLPDALYNWP